MIGPMRAEALNCWTAALLHLAKFSVRFQARGIKWVYGC